MRDGARMIPGVSLGSRISAVEADRPVHLTSFSTLLYSMPGRTRSPYKISGSPWFSPVRVGFPSFWVGFLRVSYMLNMYRIRACYYIGIMMIPLPFPLFCLFCAPVLSSRLYCSSRLIE